MRIDVLTIFPEYLEGPLGVSLLGKAQERGLLDVRTHDLRQHTDDRHQTVDGAPYGGGAGMVMRADVVDAAISAAALPGAPLVYLTPRGEPLTQKRIAGLAAGPGVTLICGRYEGLDQRVLEAHDVIEISLGDFVLSGGEPAALALLDACVRLLPGVMGAEASLEEESFARGLLEYPHYTRPADWRGRAVPEVLLSGHHEKICAWRTEQAEIITRKRRPDLWDRYRKGRTIEKEHCHERD